MRARAPMEAGGRLGGPRANGFNEQILGADKQVPGRAQGKRREDVAEIRLPPPPRCDNFLRSSRPCVK